MVSSSSKHKALIVILVPYVAEAAKALEAAHAVFPAGIMMPNKHMGHMYYVALLIADITLLYGWWGGLHELLQALSPQKILREECFLHGLQSTCAWVMTMSFTIFQIWTQ